MVHGAIPKAAGLFAEAIRQGTGIDLPGWD
jgi:hypothetical protein